MLTTFLAAVLCFACAALMSGHSVAVAQEGKLAVYASHIGEDSVCK